MADVEKDCPTCEEKADAKKQASIRKWKDAKIASGAKVWVGPCDCCYLLRKDAEKKDVFFCGLCQSWLCRKCEQNYLKRGAAFVLKILGKA